MTPSLIITVTILLLLSMYVIGETIFYRKELPCMTGMMIAMINGMNVGLTLGVILGILYQGNLFQTTIIGMAFGIVIGFLSGVPISIMAVLDGMLSGIMGGMMGTMLGNMITPPYGEPLIKVMFTIYLAITLILLYMMQQELNKGRYSIISSPVTLLLIFGLFFYGLQFLSPFTQ